MEGYTTRITAASHDLTARERIRLKNFDGAISLNNIDSGASITPVKWASIAVHNELAKPKDGKPANTDYTVFVIEDDEGNLYQTSSSSFIESFTDIWTEMAVEGEEWSFSVAKHKSANNSGSYLTCNIL